MVTGIQTAVTEGSTQPHSSPSKFLGRRKQYDKTTEAAWYVLSPFVHVLDCSQKVLTDSGETKIVALNTNQNLEYLYNGTLVSWQKDVSDGWRCVPTPKEQGGALYRAAYFTKARLCLHLYGYETLYYRSRYNAIARLGFARSDAQAKALPFAQELGIAEKVRKFDQVGILLPCLDIDCHKGERDVEKARDLILARFPQSYWEPSTNGKGVHVYLKVSYPIAKNHYRQLLLIRHTLKELALLLDQERISKGIDAPIDRMTGLPSVVVVQNHEVRILERTQCIKVPMFSNGMNDILEFHKAPFILFENLQPLVNQERNSVNDTVLNDKGGCSLFDDTELLKEFNEGEGWEEGNNNIPTIEYTTVCTASYTSTVAQMMGEPDAFLRTVEFCKVYARKRKKKETDITQALITEFIEEYCHQGLNTGEDRGRRRLRFKQVLQSIYRTFQPERLVAVDYSGFENEKPSLLALIQKRLPSFSDPKVEKQVPVTLDDLAAILFAMKKNRPEGGRVQFSYKQAIGAYRSIMGKTPNRNRIAKIFRALQEGGLIETTNGYMPGVVGRRWRITVQE